MSSADGLLFVCAEPGTDVGDHEFNEWYDNEHAPARLTLPGFHNAIRFKATDDKKPSYLAIYDGDSPDTFTSDAYKRIASRASAHERALVPKLELLNRKILKLIEYRSPTFQVSPPAPPFVFIVEFSVSAELDDEFNRWYSEEHIGEFSKVKGWRRCRRYTLVSQVELGRDSDKPLPSPVRNYLTIHDFDDNDYDKDPEFDNAAKTPWSRDVLSKVAGADVRKFALLKDFKRE